MQHRVSPEMFFAYVQGVWCSGRTVAIGATGEGSNPSMPECILLPPGLRSWTNSVLRKEIFANGESKKRPLLGPVRRRNTSSSSAGTALVSFPKVWQIESVRSNLF